MIAKTHRIRPRTAAFLTTPASAFAFGVALLATMLPAATARAAEPENDPDQRSYDPNDYDDHKPERRGFQLEGMIGGSGCIPGRAPCRYQGELFSGSTQPSLGAGFTLGWRARKWLFFGAGYRLGMFQPNYDGPSSNYRYAAQHTAALIVRPILPIWRFDLGLNIAPGYSRQVFRYADSTDRDWSQGFSMMVGPTVDIWLSNHFFLGAEVDFIFNTQRRVCLERGDAELCSDSAEYQLAPTHQALFGIHLGGTISR